MQVYRDHGRLMNSQNLRLRRLAKLTALPSHRLRAERVAQIGAPETMSLAARKIDFEELGLSSGGAQANFIG